MTNDKLARFMELDKLLSVEKSNNKDSKYMMDLMKEQDEILADLMQNEEETLHHMDMMIEEEKNKSQKEQIKNIITGTVKATSAIMFVFGCFKVYNKFKG